LKEKLNMDLYIYYRADCEHAQALQTQVPAMQAALAKDYGIAVAFKRRPEEKDGQNTWMEVYLAVPQDFETALARAVTRAKLDSLIDGKRHTEYFLDISSCA
jgi:hypothetical protein